MSLAASRPELLPNGGDALLRRALQDAVAFSVRLQEIRNRLGEAIGLSGSAYSILTVIGHLSETGEVGVSRIAEHLHLSGAFVTIEVGKLVKAGLLRKTPDPQDGRRVIVRVTKKGAALLDQLVEIRRPVNDLIFGRLDAQQFLAFADIIPLLVSGTEESLVLLRYMAEQRRRQA